jgi:hypothetical protein
VDLVTGVQQLIGEAIDFGTDSVLQRFDFHVSFLHA